MPWIKVSADVMSAISQWTQKAGITVSSDDAEAWNDPPHLAWTDGAEALASQKRYNRVKKTLFEAWLAAKE